MPRSISEVSDVVGYYLFDSSTLTSQFAKQVQTNTWNDILVSLYTCLFISSKNQEVEPLGINDITLHLLKDLRLPTQSIVNKERDVRSKIGHELETTTYFDFVMFYMKVWKIRCEMEFQSP
jgi:hypothetical protein